MRGTSSPRHSACERTTQQKLLECSQKLRYAMKMADESERRLALLHRRLISIHQREDPATHAQLGPKHCALLYKWRWLAAAKRAESFQQEVSHALLGQRALEAALEKAKSQLDVVTATLRCTQGENEVLLQAMCLETMSSDGEMTQRSL